MGDEEETNTVASRMVLEILLPKKHVNVVIAIGNARKIIPDKIPILSDALSWTTGHTSSGATVHRCVSLLSEDTGAELRCSKLGRVAHSCAPAG